MSVDQQVLDFTELVGWQRQAAVGEFCGRCCQRNIQDKGTL